MVFIIHFPTAWKQLCAKYNIVTTQSPNSWPVLVSFNESAEGAPISTIALVDISQAAKLLSKATPNQWDQIDISIRKQIMLTVLPHKMQPIPMGTPGVDMIQGNDPITGEEGILAVQIENGVPEGNIAGLEALPQDPSKLDSKQKIADLGDPTEHVLDDERAI